jgi:hypothetical protein
MKRVAPFVASVAFGFAALTPSAGATSATKPATAEALAAVVAAHGLGCADLQASVGGITLGNLPKGDRGGCTIDGEHSSVTVYKTRADLREVQRAMPTVGCSFAKGFGETTLRFVVGNNWAISTPSTATAPKLAAALNAKTVTFNCK